MVLSNQMLPWYLIKICNSYVHICIHTFRNIYANAHLYMCVCVCVPSTYIQLYIYVCTCTDRRSIFIIFYSAHTVLTEELRQSQRIALRDVVRTLLWRQSSHGNMFHDIKVVSLCYQFPCLLLFIHINLFTLT